MDQYREFSRGFLSEAAKRNPEFHPHDRMKHCAAAWSGRGSEMQENPGNGSLFEILALVGVVAFAVTHQEQVKSILHNAADTLGIHVAAGAAAGASTLALAAPQPAANTGSTNGISNADIQTWANNLGNGSQFLCIGQEFVKERGHLPGSIDELNSWGVSSGHYKNGNWNC